jgi:energy-coupling factor transport system permease protein
MKRRISDVSLGGYIPGHSLMHRLDPRTKLLGIALALAGVFLARSIQGAVVMTVSILGIAALSGAGWRIWFWGVSRFRWMLGIAGIVNLLFHRGGTFIVVAGYTLPVTAEAAFSSGLLVAQLLAAMVLSLALTFTTTPRELTKGCEWLAKPLKRFNIPVEDLALVVLMAMRFVPLLQQELTNTIDAQKARGVEFSRGSAATRAGNLVAVLVPAVMGTLRRADLLAVAMTARGFRQGQPRSEYAPLCFSLKDAGAATLTVSFVISQIMLNRWPI